MNLQKNRRIYSSRVLLLALLWTGLAAGLTGCGVKGDPLPPIRPAELGRGRPTYKRATESLTIENSRVPSGPKRPAVHTGDDDEDEDE